MDFFEVVKKRHSYRGGFCSGFNEMKVRHEDVLKIIQAGLDAPTGMHCQTTRFVIVSAPHLIAQIAACRLRPNHLQPR